MLTQHKIRQKDVMNAKHILKLIYLAFLGAFFLQEQTMAAPFSFEFPEAVISLQTQEPAYINASDGLRLAYYNFVAQQPNMIMIFYHGGGIWSNRLYQYFAQQLQEKHGISTYLFDTRGHGNSEGPRGDTTSTEHVWQDITSAIDFVHKKHPDCPIFLGGHSSGAGMVLNYAGWHEHPAVSGYLFLAPFLGSQSGTNYEHSDTKKNFIKDVRLFPLIVHALTKGYFFANTPAIYFNYPEQEKLNDPHILEYYTCAMAQATSPYDPVDLFKKLTKPFLLLAGEKDEQFIPEKIIAFLQHAAQVKDQSIAQVIPQATHLSILVDSPAIIAQALHKLPKQ
jgi:acylglycerol lipase